ncbi:hypothetical protein HXZ62_13865 [Empedobacter falsenii]|uniref:Bacteriocin n=1 Tax=Empedobacter falsenii TaxID=343874 RepID=A0AAW7DMR5_9FLAO|nr:MULTISPECIES: hypothetical protein [Empedobacter]MDH2208186.1 hypothetical protein [Empedobacter sp. GD03644]MDM1063637.1 hypothetical protein [Empedobacter falsenii]MDM1549227.1 hypothetical protein [Empedobacter falsenii]MDM1552831.1 hypothetical protein [Empedobacter falsenii]
MKKSINDFQVEKLEDRKEFIFYCLLHLFCGGHGGGSTTPDPGPGGGDQ